MKKLQLMKETANVVRAMRELRIGVEDSDPPHLVLAWKTALKAYKDALNLRLYS